MGQADKNIEMLKSLCFESWSNEACLGYVLLACRMLEYRQEEMQELLAGVNLAFDNYSLEQAQKKYRCFREV